LGLGWLRRCGLLWLGCFYNWRYRRFLWFCLGCFLGLLWLGRFYNWRRLRLLGFCLGCFFRPWGFRRFCSSRLYRSLLLFGYRDIGGSICLDRRFGKWNIQWLHRACWIGWRVGLG
jgi:hypothetical protein